MIGKGWKMSSVRRILVLLAHIAPLTACVEWGPGPDITGETPNAVTIRYDATQVDPQAADHYADFHCSGYDKVAKLRSRFASKPSMTYADYACVTPPAPLSSPSAATPIVPPADGTPPAMQPIGPLPGADIPADKVDAPEAL